jgi:flagellar biosynthesis protein FlhB
MAMKTEEPTPRRLQKAREQGDSPISHPLGAAVGLAVALLLLPQAVLATAARAEERWKAALGGAAQAPAATSVVLDVLGLAAPLVLAVALAAAAVGLVQTRGIVSGARLAPKLERLDPVEGMKQLFRLERVFSLMRALLAALFVAAFAYALFADHARDLVELPGNDRAVGPLIARLGTRLGWAAALSGIALGLVDLLLVQRSFRARHRMSKDEVRREHREAEGDPEVRARRKRAHQEAVAGSIVNAVRDATVVIVNPTHLASALRYVEDEDQAPKVVAQGRGELARRIVDAARAYGIPCIQDVPVARALAELEVGDEIPEALYAAVAEILKELLEKARDGGNAG